MSCENGNFDNSECRINTPPRTPSSAEDFKTLFDKQSEIKKQKQTEIKNLEEKDPNYIPTNDDFDSAFGFTVTGWQKLWNENPKASNHVKFPDKKSDNWKSPNIYTNNPLGNINIWVQKIKNSN